MNKVVLFDFDGVLVDSEECHATAAQQYMKNAFKIMVPLGELVQLTGLTGLEKVGRLLDKYGIKHKLNDIKVEKIRYIYLQLSQELKPKKGIKELLDNLKIRGHKLGVVSSMFRADIEKFLKKNRLDTYFDLIVGYEDVKNKKPHPEPYLTAIKKFGERNTYFAIEDSSNGVKSAKSAGIKHIIGLVGKADGHLESEFEVIKNPFVISYIVENTV